MIDIPRTIELFQNDDLSYESALSRINCADLLNCSDCTLALEHTCTLNKDESEQELIHNLKIRIPEYFI